MNAAREYLQVTRMVQKNPKLAELEDKAAFIDRHIGPGESDRQKMLKALGVDSVETLISQVVPAAIRSEELLALDESCTEQEALDYLKSVAQKNDVYKSFIGQGYYNSFTPGVIVRNVLENPGWYTAYTPYQPEISQGRLEAILNFQTMVADLTGMDLANASMLDEGTAAAEAMTLCQRMSKSKSNVFFVSGECLPQTIGVIKTRARPIGIELVIGDHRTDLENLECFGALFQYPAADGGVFDYSDAIARAHANGALVVMAADLLGLMLLKSPGKLDADVAVGTSQRFGVPLGFGGPHAGYMATREKFKRSMPGRIVGVSIDDQGKPAYRLALQTREQHIRREKATSNICTAQVLLAVVAGMYAVYHGPRGLRLIAQRTHHLTNILARGIERLGYRLVADTWFDTLTIETGDRTAAIHQAVRGQGINLREVSATRMGISLDETATAEDLETLWTAFAQRREINFNIASIEADLSECLPEAFLRTEEVLHHPVFNHYHSETEMMRYLRLLADRDIALDRAMIPLGSCTMKLNAASEMLPVTWPEFSRIHPLVPADQAQGYHQLIDELEKMLCEVTGYDAISLQPNAGSQGEYAGLLAIRAYHESLGEGHRNICLIPSSAHGTNPASAQMCGLKVVVVKCDDQGNVDMADLQDKVEQYSGDLSSIMVTYPSTHGVFEEQIKQICNRVHDHGGQVYIDGANLNAMVGLCQPGKFGGDVSHLNLHKTFCIPHGGGGPGVGPIGVAAHLAPFIPGQNGLSQEGFVSSAAWGSAGILSISWMYIKMMGRNGLQEATKTAILNANYMAKRLGRLYPILYTGANGRVAHECILDLRPIKNATGISVDDVAKRLIDFGFHAPTMSFPVAGTLMIEPTESESLAEMNRFCHAMISIRHEIAAIADGYIDAGDSPLKHAPHTAEVVTADHWEQAYTRSQAAYPVESLRNNKYWSPVGRVDNIYGDRNLMCSCPAISDYEQGLV